MLGYREKVTTNTNKAEPRIPDNRMRPKLVGEPFMDLGAKYGLPEDIIIGNPSNSGEQMVEEEYLAYVTVPCSSRDVPSLKFWEVSGESDDINGVN